MNTACTLCRTPATQLPPPRWWIGPDRLACSHACAARLNELRSTAELSPIRWRYVEQRAEQRDSSIAELTLLLTLAHLRANAFLAGPATRDCDSSPPTGAADELQFLTGAAVVILSKRDNLMRS